MTDQTIRPVLSIPRLITTFFLILLGSSVFAAESAGLSKEFINSNPSYSHIATVTAGGVKTIYVSGQVGLRDGQVPQSFTEQVDIVFSNMSTQLEAAGAGLADVIKLTGFIVDISSDKVTQYSTVRSRYFSSDVPAPASTLVGVAGLVRESFLVEVEAVAVIAAP